MAFNRGLLLPVMPLYARSFEVSFGLVGLVLAAQGLGKVIGDVPAGVMVRHWGHKNTMLLGGVCGVIGALGLIGSRNLGEVFLCQFLAGLGEACWNISRHAFIADMVQVEKRGRSIALLGGIGRMGSFAGPALGGMIAGAFGLRVPFVFYGLLGVVGVAAVLIWVPGGITRHENSEENVGLGDVLTNHFHILAKAGAGHLCAQMVRAGRNVIIPLFGAEVLGLEVTSLGWIISIASGVDMLMFYPAGVIMDRWGRKWAYVPSFLIQAVGMALMPLSSSFFSLLAVAILIGLGNGLGSGTMMTLGADLAPVRSRGEFIGVWRFIGDTGSTGGPLVIGGVADLFGLGVTPLVIAGVGVLGASMLGLLVPETLKAKRPIEKQS
jgi:MFS family permease